MSGVENGAKPKLVEFQKGLFVFQNLQRNSTEDARRLIDEIKESAERIREERTKGLIVASQSHPLRV